MQPTLSGCQHADGSFFTSPEAVLVLLEVLLIQVLLMHTPAPCRHMQPTSAVSPAFEFKDKDGLPCESKGPRCPVSSFAKSTLSQCSKDLEGAT